MKKEESLKKEIDYQISVKAQLWTAVLASSGASLALFFSIDSIIKLIASFISFMLAIFFLNDYFNKTLLLRGLLTKLEELIDD